MSTETMKSSQGNWGFLKEPRLGIMVHYDGSASDPGAVAWLTKDPACRVSYNWLVLDTGEVVEIAPRSARAWHAGVCRPSSKILPYADANSAFYGFAIAARPPDQVTLAQLQSVVSLCREMFFIHAWSLNETWRIVGHNTEAWPRGRKIDPEGPDKFRPVLSVDRVRQMVRGLP